MIYTLAVIVVWFIMGLLVAIALGFIMEEMTTQSSLEYGDFEKEYDHE